MAKSNFSDAPARLKKELNSLLNLQSEIAHLERSIEDAANFIGTGINVGRVLAKYQGMQEEVERLYTALNITESFPELEGVGFEFVQMLLLARDLKINIRKHAIGSFFECDKLDQAVGGRAQPLGMFCAHDLCTKSET